MTDAASRVPGSFASDHCIVSSTSLTKHGTVDTGLSMVGMNYRMQLRDWPVSLVPLNSRSPIPNHVYVLFNRPNQQRDCIFCDDLHMMHVSVYTVIYTYVLASKPGLGLKALALLRPRCQHGHSVAGSDQLYRSSTKLTQALIKILHNNNAMYVLQCCIRQGQPPFRICNLYRGAATYTYIRRAPCATQ